MNVTIEALFVQVANCNAKVRHELVPGIVREKTTCKAGQQANLAVPNKVGFPILICSADCPDCIKI